MAHCPEPGVVVADVPVIADRSRPAPKRLIVRVLSPETLIQKSARLWNTFLLSFFALIIAWGVALLLDPEADAMTGSTLMLDSGRRRGLP